MTTRTTMTTERLPTDPKQLAELLAADDRPDDVDARLAEQEGTARATRLLGSARRILERAAAAKRNADADAAAKAATPPKPRGRTRVGAAGGYPGRPGQTKGTPLRLFAGDTERVDALAARLTIEKIAAGGSAKTVSRNEIIRSAIDAMLADPPRRGDVDTRNPYGAKAPRITPMLAADHEARLDALGAALGDEMAPVKRVHLIRHAVARYLDTHAPEKP